MEKIKVVIFDDSEEICEYFCNIINSQDNMEVVACAKSGEDALELMEKYKPDIVLMDIQMETECAGIDATKSISEEYPNIKVIMLTVHSDKNFVLDAYIAGAVDYINKMSGKDAVIQSINNVYHNEGYLGNTIAENVKNAITDTRTHEQSLLFLLNNFSKLSVTELNIVKLLCQGYNKTEIAKMQYKEYSTIKSQVRSILHKLNFKSTSIMVKFLKENGIFKYL